jgi:4-hydroxythreonine-4-phosphate dehydrogenase
MKNKKNNIKVGISVGDLNGIGAEIILRTFQNKMMFDICTPIIFASTKAMSYERKLLGLDINIHGITNTDNAVANKLNVLNLWKDPVPIELGKPSEEIGKYAVDSFKKAVEHLKRGEIDVLVTAPFNKETIQNEEFDFPGHTDYLAQELEGKPLMFMVTDKLKVGLVTDHVPLKYVAQQITEEKIIEKIATMSESLKQDFGISKPKIAVLGLNPHCGDGGIIGKEDDEIIRPTIISLKKQGQLIYGPYAADSFFGSDSYLKFDAVLAMYHDQGLIPFKTLSFGKGVNYTAGLNHIRTSPDHGTAYEIAGKNLANPQSFKEAIFMAIDIFRKRKEYAELTENVLQKQEMKK